MTRHCDLCVARCADGFVIRIQGKGTSAQSPSLAEFVNGCFLSDPESIVYVDLLGCEYLDSTFLGCLLKLQRSGTAERFQVAADAAARKRLLQATCLDRALALLDEPPPCTGTFQRIETEPLSQKDLGRHMMETHAALGELPSPAAQVFQRIADQLGHELLQDSNFDEPGLMDTAIIQAPKARNPSQ